MGKGKEVGRERSEEEGCLCVWRRKGKEKKKKGVL
jgi:hypothetical protein